MERREKNDFNFDGKSTRECIIASTMPVEARRVLTHYVLVYNARARARARVCVCVCVCV